MGHQHLMELHHSNHWPHRCDMKLFGSSKYGVMAVGSVTFGSGLNSENQTFDFDTSQHKMCHGLAPTCHENTLRHHHTNHWFHMCDETLIDSNKYGVMTVGSVSFGSGLNSEIQILDKCWLKMCHGLALMGHQNLMELPHTNHWSQRFDSSKYGVMAVGSVSFGSGLNSEIHILDKSRLKMCHGSAPMCHEIIMRHHHTNHWSHRCDMKLYGSSKYGVMAVGSVSFGKGLNSEIQIFDKF
jgi:hypothetical protein